VDIQCPHELQVSGAPGAYSQIVTNLVMNSVTHAFEDMEAGHIGITVSEEPEGLLLRYSDDGKGIVAEHLEKIFDPFFTTKRGAGGSGLGLHIVYNLVTQALGGAIACSSTPGKGVVFEIHIPVPPMEQETVTPASTGIAMA
jgi:signal transduction histidine kinase